MRQKWQLADGGGLNDSLIFSEQERFDDLPMQIVPIAFAVKIYGNKSAGLTQQGFPAGSN